MGHRLSVLEIDNDGDGDGDYTATGSQGDMCFILR